MVKRYILLIADEGLSEPEKKELRSIIERMHQMAKLIEVEGDPRAVIVKATEAVARQLRNPRSSLTVGGKKLTSVLTSGSVGNLKKRALEAEANGQVHE